MSTEESLLNDIFSPGLYKNKYKLIWCENCDCVAFICNACMNGSCNGGGCDECYNDSIEFHQSKISLRDYLPEDELWIYDKIESLKYHMLRSLAKSEKEIDFNKLKESGELSQNEEKMFLS